MKKNLLIICLLCIGMTLFAQVKVGDNHQIIHESAVFELESTNKGFLLPRLTTEQRDAIENPAEGLLIYNLDTKCVDYFNAEEWVNSCGIGQSEFQIINCSSSASGYLVKGITTEDPDETEILPIQSIEVDVAETGYFSIESDMVNGILFSAEGEFTETGLQNVALTAIGTPTNFGSHTFSVEGCSFDRKTYIPDRRYKDVTLQGEDGIEKRWHRHIYNWVTSDTGEIWLQTNLGADYNNVDYEGVFDPDATPYSLSDFYAFGSYYQWGRYSDGHELVEPRTQAGYGVSYNSVNQYTSVQSSTDDPGHNDVISGDFSPGDWRAPQNSNLWQGESGVNNPCPNDFRLATIEEWQAELAAYSVTSPSHAFVSPLKLVNACSHDASGVAGEYWTSTTAIAANGSESTGIFVMEYIFFPLAGLQIDTNGNVRVDRYSVRCVQD